MANIKLFPCMSEPLGGQERQCNYILEVAPRLTVSLLKVHRAEEEIYSYPRPPEILASTTLTYTIEHVIITIGSQRREANHCLLDVVMSGTSTDVDTKSPGTR